MLTEKLRKVEIMGILSLSTLNWILIVVGVVVLVVAIVINKRK
ncbi:hypothetical protein ACFL1G_06130 [Planctomycetota bacterium]